MIRVPNTGRPSSTATGHLYNAAPVVKVTTYGLAAGLAAAIEHSGRVVRVLSLPLGAALRWLGSGWQFLVVPQPLLILKGTEQQVTG
jgi:hypothetical protein